MVDFKSNWSILMRGTGMFGGWWMMDGLDWRNWLVVVEWYWWLWEWKDGCWMMDWKVW